MVTRSAGGGLEGQVTAENINTLRDKLQKLTNKNHHHHIITHSSTVDSFDSHIAGYVVGDGYLCRGGLHGDW